MISKQDYLKQIRSASTYPTYRGIIGIMTNLFYILAALQGLGALIFGFISMRVNVGVGFLVILLGLVMAVISYFLARFFKEGALILADIGDSITDTNARLSAQ